MLGSVRREEVVTQIFAKRLISLNDKLLFYLGPEQDYNTDMYTA